MGACGCGEGYDYRLKAPRGWYLIKVYPGCEDCDTPAGIHIDHETERHGFADDLPDYQISDGAGEGIAVVSIESVKSSLLKEVGEAQADGMSLAEHIEFDDLHKRIFRSSVDGAMYGREGGERGN